MKVYGSLGNELGHMAQMAAMPIYGKNIKHLLLQHPALLLGMYSIDSSTTEIVQMLTLG